MNDRDFCFWLQGFAELNGNTPPTIAQWDSIREHLATVFHKVTSPVNLNPCVLGPNLMYPAADPAKVYKDIIDNQRFPAPFEYKVVC